ncbi:MAG: hypothetical protein ABJH07_00690 [Sedimentitalea sp.]|uniref:hypothetical protein n=1 Tax=Sedimentitalea sp. TaxID=2048915 RepID=UPI0032671EE3
MERQEVQRILDAGWTELERVDLGKIRPITDMQGGTPIVGRRGYNSGGVGVTQRMLLGVLLLLADELDTEPHETAQISIEAISVLRQPDDTSPMIYYRKKRVQGYIDSIRKMVEGINHQRYKNARKSQQNRDQQKDMSVRYCPQCGTAIARGTHARQKFCGATCRVAAHRAAQ